MRRSARAGLGVAVALALAGCSPAVMQAKKVAADSLVDPKSAQFRNLSVHSSTPKDEKVARKYVCGEINGKNRMGAYAGFTRFMFRPDNAAFAMDPQETVTEAQTEQALRDCHEELASEYGSSHYRCDDAKEKRDKRIAQLEFEIAWLSTCRADTVKADPPTKS